MRVVSESEAATRSLAAKLGAAGKAGDVVTLEGALGTGKTTFSQGFARGAGFRGSVVSPSFGLARRYRIGNKVIHHLDLYRLSGADLPNLALEEYFDDPAAICLVEWPEVAAAELPKDRLRVKLSHAGESTRRLELAASGPRSRRLLAEAK